MHAELISTLAAQRCREAVPAQRSRPAAQSAPAVIRPRRAARALRLALPSLRVSVARTTLAAAAGCRRGRSYVIVISATRTL